MSGSWLFGGSSGVSPTCRNATPCPKTGGAWGFLPVSAAGAWCPSLASEPPSAGTGLGLRTPRASQGLRVLRTLLVSREPSRASGSQTGVSYLSLMARTWLRITEHFLLYWLEPFGACILFPVCFISLNFTLLILLI